MMPEFIKALVLLISIAIVLCIWGTSGAAAYQSVVSPEVAFSTPSYEGLLDWISGAWRSFVIFATIAFWVVIALLGTFVVLFIAVALGVVSWLIQRVTQGIAYLVGIIKSQWTTTQKKEVTITVAHRPDGSGVSVQEWMAEAHSTISSMDVRIEALEKSSGTA